MSQFKRERRYVVIKLSKLTQEEKDLLQARDDEIGLEEYVFPECVVVEADWPNYEETWATVQAVAEGTYIPRSQLQAELDALVAQVAQLKVSLQFMVDNIGQPNCIETKDGFNAAKLALREVK